MAMLDESKLPGIPAPTAAAAKSAIANAFWKWFAEHKNDVLLERKVLFFSLKIRVNDLRTLFTELFGYPPALV